MATPKNISFSHLSKYRLSFPFMDFLGSPTEKEKGEGVTLYCSSVSLPPLSMPPVGVDTPYYQMKIPYSDMSWGELRAVYSVDEYFDNYNFLLNWMLAIKNPELYHLGGPPEMVQASLHIYTNNDNPKFSFTLVNIFPIMLDGINFTKESVDSEDIKNTVSFSIDYYKLEK